MQSNTLNHPALILGMYETGLSVGRSLARKGVKVFGLDHKIDTGFYSKYITALICPHPISEEELFLDFLIKFSGQFNATPVLFIAADEFLEVYSKNRKIINEYYLSNIPDDEILSLAFSKYSLAEKAKEIGVEIPSTFYFSGITEPEEVLERLDYPFIIKANNVNEWRAKINSTAKTYQIRSSHDLLDILVKLNNSGIGWIAQEIIPGSDECHFKFCGYFSKYLNGGCYFQLKKIRQYPVRFGVGCSVISIYSSELYKCGIKFFNGVNYKGIGSCEFKYDERYGIFKLIELNARYWQQYSLAERCGCNMAYADYLEATGIITDFNTAYDAGIKWINIHLDFISFLTYRKEGQIEFGDWLESIRGEKLFSDFTSDDPLPFLYEIKFGKRLLNITKLFNIK